MAKNKFHAFYKMTGGGNDFILMDNRKKSLQEGYDILAKKLCQEKFSIGADGLIVMEADAHSHFRMVYYNADGSRAEMCGNGARCIARFAHLLDVAPQKMNFSTDAGMLWAEINGEIVKVKMSPPKHLRENLNLKLKNGQEIQVTYLNTGVPHVVLVVDHVDQVEIAALGRELRHHPQFSPAGTNVNFVQKLSANSLTVRTYERGVEAETLACGTGVVASALVCGNQNKVSPPVSCLTKGGESLKVYFSMAKDSKKINSDEIYLEGSATVSFRGEVEV